MATKGKQSLVDRIKALQARVDKQSKKDALKKQIDDAKKALKALK